MKKLIIILFLIIFITGCNPIQAEPEYDIANQLYDHQQLLRNMNTLLSRVYYGYARNDNYELDGFTAFTISYKEKYYIITAGHNVENEDGKFYNFKFRANFDNRWIHPELLTYEAIPHTGSDYAVFYSSEIENGLSINCEIPDAQKLYVLGSTNNTLNVMRELNTPSKFGECGSPVVNCKGEVVGVFNSYPGKFLGYSPIGKVAEAIDSLK